MTDFAMKPAREGIERQDGPDYSGVVFQWGDQRLAVSPNGGRYLVQKLVPEHDIYSVVRWAKTLSRLLERAPELTRFDAIRQLPELPAEAAPETVARRASENDAFVRNSVHRCEYERVIALDGRLRLAVAYDASEYLGQIASVYEDNEEVRPNTWRTIIRSETISGLRDRIIGSDAAWQVGNFTFIRSDVLEGALATLPENACDGSWAELPDRPESAAERRQKAKLEREAPQGA